MLWHPAAPRLACACRCTGTTTSWTASVSGVPALAARQHSAGCCTPVARIGLYLVTQLWCWGACGRHTAAAEEACPLAHPACRRRCQRGKAEAWAALGQREQGLACAAVAPRCMRAWCAACLRSRRVNECAGFRSARHAHPHTQGSLGWMRGDNSVVVHFHNVSGTHAASSASLPAPPTARAMHARWPSPTEPRRTSGCPCSHPHQSLVRGTCCSCRLR